MNSKIQSDLGFAEISVGKCFVILWVLSNVLYDTNALTNMYIHVPEAVRTGESVTLSCEYDLESAALYIIKWFRNEEEFYRYVPRESPPSQIFPMTHLHVDESTSNWSNVTLVNVERGTSGEFKCEVTADAPLFHTEARAAPLIVADIPEDGPNLRTDVHKVAPGAHIRTNCTTPGSFPRMNITWFLNDIEISLQMGLIAESTMAYYDTLHGLEYVVSTVSLRATPDSFKNGKMHLRCLATIFNMYARSVEIELLEDAPQVALIMVSLDRTNSGYCIPTNYVLMTLLLFSPFLTPG